MSEARWDLLEDPEIDRVMRLVVAKLVRRFAGVVDADDALQEARIIVAMQREIDLETADSAFVNEFLYRRLHDVFETSMSRAAKSISRDALVDAELDAEGA